jgi:hypothetical protein
MAELLRLIRISQADLDGDKDTESAVVYQYQKKIPISSDEIIQN